MTDERTADAVVWLLAADEPAVRHLARRDLIGEESEPDRAAITTGPWVSALLEGQQDDGGFGGDPYRKWTGAQAQWWRPPAARSALRSSTGVPPASPA